VSHRPLVLVFGLTVGDYLLWNWSLGANHDVLALVSGLTLPPVALAFVWLLALSFARLLARVIRRRPALNNERQRRRATPARPATADVPVREPSTPTTPAGSSSRKLAA
jgi:hypothetical protein